MSDKIWSCLQGSLPRGLITDTNIGTGTRFMYVQLTNCIQIILTATKFGRFSVNVFAFNNRAEWAYCTRTRNKGLSPTRKEGHLQRDVRLMTKKCMVTMYVTFKKADTPIKIEF